MYEKYIKILKHHSIKITSPRLEILRFLDEHQTHPNVEEIYTLIKKKYPSLSRTTVYNSLEILKKNKIVQSLAISGSELRYDIKKELHHHFICKNCGAIFDISIKCPNMNQTILGGHHVEEVQGYFKGICRTCQLKQRRRINNG